MGLRNGWQRSTLDGSITEMAPFWHRIDPGFELKPARLASQSELLETYLANPGTLRDRFGNVLRLLGMGG